MIAEWVLIMSLTVYSKAVSTTSIPFATKDACETAIKQIVTDLRNTKHYGWMMWCHPTGKKND